jgi:hypothetical protein
MSRAVWSGGVATAVLLTVASASGRQIEDWPYDKLFKAADLVVIAKAISTEDAGQEIKHKAPADCLKAVLTTLEAVHVVKGEHRDAKLVILHYRLEPGKGSSNGPLLIQFHAKEQRIQWSGGVRVQGPPDYLLFLKKRADGRYECVSGQFDPALSVKEIVEPFPPPR